MDNLLRKIFITLALVVFYRLGTFVPVPFVGENFVKALTAQSSGVFAILSGGAHGRLSLFSLGVTPYITASILLQLLGNVHEGVKQLLQNKPRYNVYLKNISLALAFFHSTAFSYYSGLLSLDNPLQGVATVLSIVSATSFAVWLADRINVYGIGNGISVMIAAGILSEFLHSYGFLLNAARLGERSILQVFVTFAVAVAVVGLVVYTESSVRKVKVSYTRNFGHQSMRDQSYLPIKVNVAGVLPVIFSGTIVMFFDYLLRLPILAVINNYVSPFVVYIALTAPLIALFTIFYAGIVFNADETAAHLKRNHGYVTGYRPGEQTARFLEKIVTRLSYLAAAYLLVITLVPELLFRSMNITSFVSGTSVMICVTVIVDLMSRVAAYRMSRRYGFNAPPM